ncbi:MAG TPA: hypothetical protein VGS41_11700 [Chthonomonadales bacterium]|nr:hypothetical protein [Chthonomonadales bacterium]
MYSITGMEVEIHASQLYAYAGPTPQPSRAGSFAGMKQACCSVHSIAPLSAEQRPMLRGRIVGDSIRLEKSAYG